MARKVRIKVSLEDDVSGPLGMMRDSYDQLTAARGVIGIGDAVRSGPATVRMLGDALSALSTEGRRRQTYLVGEKGPEILLHG